MPFNLIEGEYGQRYTVQAKMAFSTIPQITLLLMPYPVGKTSFSKHSSLQIFSLQDGIEILQHGFLME